jgi:leucyl-tRNA synthetase
MYNFLKIEQKWQNKWVLNHKSQPKYYVLEMFPYPSGKPHMGHIKNYTLGDVIARFKRACGYDVIHPMGWDAFGLPAENAAKQFNINPKIWTKQNIAQMKNILQSFGFSYDWDREVATCDSEYYKHEQEFFIKFFENNLIYQKESLVNWDPVDQTVLANEQVINGRGWRSNAIVEKKMMKQWFFKITKYADELLNDIDDKLQAWPEGIKTMQKNWINKSEGVLIRLKVSNQDIIIPIYTTRPETIYGMSFIGISYDHEIVKQLKNDQVNNFIRECSQDSIAEAIIETKEKKGVFTGLYVDHPFEDRQVPVYIVNFVISTYGTGAIFGCPAHDQRDYDFAFKYNLPILQVIAADFLPHIEDGIMINSPLINGLTATEAKQVIINKLIETQHGERKIQYRLRDWSISRQKYWGCPIPIVYCDDCGVIPENKLPVILPENINFNHPNNPLEHAEEWKKTICPKCAKPAIRETDTLDTFFESSWYFLYFASKNLDQKIINQWLPVDCYIGGAEHAVLHLLYARFFTKALRDLGYLKFNEPFTKLFNQGMVCNMAYKNPRGEWVEYNEPNARPIGVEKMSKSKKNGVDPDEYRQLFGADTIRLFLLSDSPPEKDLEWSESGIKGIHKYLNKLFHLTHELKNVHDSKMDIGLEKLRNRTIKLVTEEIENFGINKAIALIREMTNHINLNNKTLQHKSLLETAVQLLHPMIPHITEEIWEMLDQKTYLSNTSWPTYDETLLEDTIIKLPIQINGKTKTIITVDKNANIENIARQAVHSFLDQQEIKKIIYVKEKIINFII